jgi:hypothetical protein
MQFSNQKFWLEIQNQIKNPDPFWIPNSMSDFNRPWIVQGVLDFSGNW